MRGTSALYFKSLNRPFNIFGVEKSMFYLSVAVCMPIAFSARLIPIMDVIAIFIFLILYFFCKLVTSADNQMFLIYKRHISYQRYYTAISGIHSKIPKINASVPFTK